MTLADNQKIIVQTPATTANLGPGFDSFGMALTLYNYFSFQRAERDTLTIHPQSTVSTEGLLDVSAEALKNNLVFKALDAFYAHRQQERPCLHVEIEAHIPLARGLGSSSTAIAAGLFAGNQILSRERGESPLSLQDLLPLGNALEGHPDNMAPALLGGALLCDGVQVYPLPWPKPWKILLAIPPDPLLTETARQAMPAHYPLEDAIFNLRKASLLTYSLLKEDTAGFRLALDDRLHHPYRGPLIPEFLPLKALAHQAGALGTVISGAGSTLAIFYEASQEDALKTALHPFKQTEFPEILFIDVDMDTRGTCLKRALKNVHNER